MKNQNASLGVIIVLILSCVTMYLVEVYLKPGYIVKSVWKIFVFALLPMIYCAYDKRLSWVELFKPGSKKQFSRSLILGVTVYAVIFSVYLLLSGFIDLDNIASQLSETYSVNKENFIFVALYISFINSLLEEFFFRGFVFLSLNKIMPRFLSYTISAAAFSIYHIAMIADWFNLWLFIFAIVGLFISGLVLNFLNEKSKNIYNSWLVHMFGNFAINTIGFIMFMK